MKVIFLGLVEQDLKDLMSVSYTHLDVYKRQGCENASDEDIIEAAKNAHAHKFIMQLKDGYDTLVSEDGGNLSQGPVSYTHLIRF